MSQEHVHDETPSQKAVILLHGLLNPNAAMWSLQRRFRNAGYVTLNCGYRSFFQSIDQIAAKTIVRCQQFHDDLPENSELSIVGHSLGAILTRRMLQQGSFPKLRRAVLLTPPNQGSHVARRFAKLSKWILPTVEQLSDHPESYVNRLPHDMPVETGVIASDPDYVIEKRCAHLPGETGFITLPGPHGLVIFRRAVFEQTRHFLEHGQFTQQSELR